MLEQSNMPAACASLAGPLSCAAAARRDREALFTNLWFFVARLLLRIPLVVNWARDPHMKHASDLSSLAIVLFARHRSSVWRPPGVTYALAARPARRSLSVHCFQRAKKDACDTWQPIGNVTGVAEGGKSVNKKASLFRPELSLHLQTFTQSLCVSL